MAKILIVEDDVKFAQKVREFLQHEQHVVDMAHNGDDGWQFLQSYQYDVVLLDWNLPGMAGVDLCKKHRATGGTTPILMLTGKDSIDDKENGLDAGADDYLTKPFHARELTARVRALTRRPAAMYTEKITLGNLTLDSSSCRVTKDGKELQLQLKEFTLLEFMMKYPNKVFSAKVLLERLWDADKEASEDTIRTYMKTLRRKISTDDYCPIKTIHGVGYKLEMEDQAAP
ncbi:MAG TPA: response regulator transcription factor [Oculatellaceae cyanobacterium]